MNAPLLRGSKVTLRPMTDDDAPHLMRWGSDPSFRHYQWGQKPGRFEEKNARAWIERMSREGDSACWVSAFGLYVPPVLVVAAAASS